jgi:hypothetical protein
MSEFEQGLSDLASTAGQAAGPRPAEAIRHRADQRVVHRNAAMWVVVGALLGGFAFGFLRPVPQSSPGGAPGTPSASPSSAPSPSAPVSPSPSTVEPSTPPPTSSDQGAPPPAANCRFDQLRVWQASGGSAASHYGVVFVFENVSGAACRMHGYPGLDAQNSNGKTVANAKRTLQGYLGGVSGSVPPTVDLPPGGFASALGEALAFDPTNTNACLPESNIIVTPPNTAGTVTFGWNESCADLEIHPVVPGTSGRT